MTKEQQTFDLIIIGAGPGGYVAAIRAAQLGMRVACVEKEKTLGGTCLNVGCIPSKALLESSEKYAEAKERLGDHGIQMNGLSLDFQKFIERKNKVVKQLTLGVAGLFKKNKITSFVGTGRILPDRSVEVNSGGNKTLLQAKNILIATGSVPVSLPQVPFDGKRIIDSTDALSLDKIPSEMIVIGGGYIGLEMGSVYLRLGTKVTVVEAFDRLIPSMDSETAGTLERILKKQGMTFQLKTSVKRSEIQGEKVIITAQDAEGKESSLTADVALVSVGRKAVVEGLGLQEIGISLDDKGKIPVNENYQTKVSGIYAVGDVIHGPMLAHKAFKEGEAAVENMAGSSSVVNYKTIPGVVYTNPEVASVGITEDEAKAQNIHYKVFKYPFMANGRSLALGNKDGFVKLLSDSETNQIIGAHLIGPHVSELIAEIVVAMEFGSTAEDLGLIIHAHPTLSEALREAALGLSTGAIHL